MRLITGVLELARELLYVFPLATHGKTPLVRTGLKAASVDLDLIGEWWRTHPRANIGVATGPWSRFFALDVDPDHGGLDTLAACPPLPDTRAVATGGGGFHYWFTWPKHLTVRNSAGKVGRGLDIRGAGGYVVAPPSVTVDQYKWLDRGPIAPAPEWLLAAIVSRPPDKRPLYEIELCSTGEPTRYGIAALLAETSRVAVAIEGTRNMSLNRSAFVLGQLEAGGELPEGYALQPLVDAAIRAGLPREESILTASSGLTAGRQYPRSRRRIA